MRTVLYPDRAVSALGFSCVSLGSRVSEAQSRRLLDYAFDHGVTWYDVAPSDGDGDAETILGRFLAGRRDQVIVSAKVGPARPNPSRVMRLFSSFKRSALNAFPELAAVSLRALKAGHEREPLRPERIGSSVLDSLRRLKTDYLDVLALQNPSVEDCRNPAIGDALADVVVKGYVRRLAIAGSPDVIEAARETDLFPVVMIRNNPFERAIERVRAAPPGGHAEFLVVQSPLGKAYERLSHLLVGDGGRLASLASQLAYGPPFMTSEILLDYAFGNNPTGVVVAAMSQIAHIEQNCARATRAPRTDVVEFVNKTVLSAPAPRGFGLRP
ncbi:putative aldo/keto reductase [Methylocella silvestris BL2]|uniref:Putative aldo/keto reductase n=1 Tax=Methylocella silvestris (strain DSM 15510 / CIP 108128 / LMG 27833 / NCIMB 13906 / BL2) TaxID=395965 RepID=B8EP70_METSB|nr:aldo/keto reductase [Methylocella silvestris]ACK49658.1 putative aldo/keto reductase [Methylocella silvestris BL2]